MTPPNPPDLAAVIERCREVQFERESAREQKRNVEKFYRDHDVMALCRAVESAQSDLAALRAELARLKAERLIGQPGVIGPELIREREDYEYAVLRAERDALALVDRISDSEMMALLKRVNREFELRVKAAEDAQLNLVKMCESKQEALDDLRAQLENTMHPAEHEQICEALRAENERLKAGLTAQIEMTSAKVFELASLRGRLAVAEAERDEITRQLRRFQEEHNLRKTLASEVIECAQRKAARTTQPEKHDE